MQLTAEQLATLREVRTTMHHAYVFIHTREKMAPVGVELYAMALKKFDDLLEEERKGAVR